jgi:hypothetical protein
LCSSQLCCSMGFPGSILKCYGNMRSNTKERSKILGVISVHDAEVVLHHLANLKDQGGIRRFIKNNRQIVAPVVTDDTAETEDRLWTLRNHLRTAWDAPDRRAREWHVFQLRRKFSEWSLEPFVLFTDPDFKKKMGFDDPHRPDKLGQPIDLSEQPPADTALEAVMFYFQTTIGDRAKHCGNTDCPAPYFIAEKRWQKYCSEDCAGPANREAKRKWWHENKGKGSL